VDALAVFMIALGTALATGLGVLPVMAARMNKGRSITPTWGTFGARGG
jgi:hypothetical protein